MTEPCSVPDLTHHGDRDLRAGLIDFAVNVRATAPPPFVADALAADVHRWAAYPDPRAACAMIARRWGVDESMVLPTSGAAEAFTLVAQALAGNESAIVHPQFTEPEAALRRLCRPVRRVLLPPAFTFDPALVPDSADLVVIGNPTNPTGQLHDPAVIRSLHAPGRILLVDEAFLDEVGDEYSLIEPEMEGILVVRSLTKSFSVAGVRAGYVVGDPALVARLRAAQTPWAVSTPALTLMQVAMTDEALAFISAQAADVEGARADLITRLGALGLPVVPSCSPFVLVDTSSIDPVRSLRIPLSKQGFAVRRGETFPGLGPTWIRLAVRTPRLHAALCAAIATIGESR